MPKPNKSLIELDSKLAELSKKWKETHDQKEKVKLMEEMDGLLEKRFGLQKD